MLKIGNPKYDCFKTYLWQDAELVGKYEMPQLEPNSFLPKNVISFNEKNSVKNIADSWIDHFIDDHNFECEWNNPVRYIQLFKRAAGVITADFSLLPELSLAQNIWNCFRNRVLAYYYQKNGINVIPVASWMDEDTFSWCFDGLPENSTIAVSSNGVLIDDYSFNIFVLGIEELQRRLHPSNLVVCGKKIKILEKYENVIYYPNFGQRRRENVNGKQR